MEAQQQQADAPAPDLTDYTSVSNWLDNGHGGAFFETRSACEWFIKQNRRELVETGALIPREGRSGSILHTKLFPRAVVQIYKRRALNKALV